MRIAAADTLFDELVELCYACVLDSNAWHGLLQRLMSACGRQSGGVLLWDQHQGGPRIGSVSMFSAETLQVYNEHFHQFDPGASFWQMHGAGEWYHDVEELGSERMRRDPFYAEFRRCEGLQSLSTLKLYEQGGSSAYLSLLTLTGASIPSQRERQLLVRMTPHLVRAGRLSERIHQLELDITRRDQLLDRHDSPIWLVNASGRVLHANHAAERWLRSGSCPMLQRGSYLHARDQPARLASLIRAAAGPAPACAGWLQSPQPSAHELLVAPFMAEGNGAGGILPGTGQRLALVVSPRRAFNGQWVADLFHLTRAECRLAEQLAGGASLEQCALLLGNTLHTVRSQLKNLFRKTGASRQAELVALLTRLGAG